MTKRKAKKVSDPFNSKRKAKKVSDPFNSDPFNSALVKHMYMTGLIDISQWDKAGWKGTMYGYANGSNVLPFLGLLFENPENGQNIFERWRRYLGDADPHKLIRVSVIEGEIEGEPQGYSVFIGTNIDAVLSLAEIRGHEVGEHVLMMGRFCRMTPPSESNNLAIFKQKYQRYGKYIFLPVIKTEQGFDPLFDLGIEKEDVNFLKVDDLKENDLEYVVLKKDKDRSGKNGEMLEAITSGGKGFTPEQITEAIDIFETELVAGKIKKPIDPMVIDSLASLKYDENGLIIPDSVNPILIATAEEIRHEVIEQEAIRIPLKDVQKQYVDFLENYFSEPYSEMLKNGLTPHQMAEFMSSNEDYVQAWQDMAPEMLRFLRQHWEATSIVTASHLRQMPTLKAVYGGNVFPHPQSNLVSNASLYVDTLVLPDPIFSCLSISSSISPKKFTYLLAKNALTAMSYKEWAVADTNVPLVVFVPNYFFLSEKLPRIIDIISKSDLQSHLRQVFDYPFNSYNDIENYFRHAPDITSLAMSVRDKERFIFDIEESPLPLDQLELITNNFEEMVSIQDNIIPPKQQILMGFQGRFMQANAALAHCDLYGGIPIIDAPTSWQYFLWKLEYSVSQLIPDIKRDALITHVLHEELRDIPSFSKMPVEGVVELRKSGKMAGLREVFRKGIGQINAADGDSVRDVAKLVSNNLRHALQEYEEQINGIRKDILSITGQSVAVAGNVGLGIAAASTGSIPLAIIASLAGSASIPTAKDIIKKGQEIYGNHKRLKNNPVGILWKI